MAVWITLFGSISEQVEGTLCLVSLSSLCWMFGMGYLICVYHLVSCGLMDAHFERFWTSTESTSQIWCIYWNELWGAIDYNLLYSHWHSFTFIYIVWMLATWTCLYWNFDLGNLFVQTIPAWGFLRRRGCSRSRGRGMQVHHSNGESRESNRQRCC